MPLFPAEHLFEWLSGWAMWSHVRHVLNSTKQFYGHWQNLGRRFYIFLWQPSSSKLLREVLQLIGLNHGHPLSPLRSTSVAFSTIIQSLVFKPDLFSLLFCLSMEEIGRSRVYLLRVGLTMYFSFWSIFYTVCQNGQVGCCLFHTRQRTRNAQRNLKPMPSVLSRVENYRTMFGF